MGKKPRVLVAMSGGIDSSVAAVLLLESGYEVIGATFKLGKTPAYTSSSTSPSFSSSESIDRAKSVAAHLGIQHHVLDYTTFFEKTVVQPFCDAYVNGRTPNPCVSCNRQVKFEKLVETARRLDIEHVATGHYARVVRDETTGAYLVKRGADPKKDQSYALCRLTQALLAHVQFPLGEAHKSEIRGYADRFDDLMRDVSESQDVCFIAGGDYKSFLMERMPNAVHPGPVFDGSGREVGKHQGIAFYTVGQRRGLGIESPHPLYVTRIDADKNALIVGPADEVYASRLMVTNMNWIPGNIPDVSETLVQIRYRHPAAPARIEVVDDETVDIEFLEPQRAVTPGQTAAFFIDDTLLGGGTISEVERHDKAATV